MKRALVCGAGGFLGNHLVNRLVREGYHVVGLSRAQPKFGPSAAQEFYTTDLRYVSPNDWFFNGVEEVYQLASESGGLGYILNHEHDAEMLRNSALINLHVLEACRAQRVPRVFFASSASANNALPNDDFVWEKLFSERLYQAYARRYGIEVRIARLHNTFGPLCVWQGGREKAPAALCRKVALAKSGDAIDIWGDGEQARSFLYVEDTIAGIRRLMQAKTAPAFPINLGSPTVVTINQVVDMLAQISCKVIRKNHIDGPQGARVISCADNAYSAQHLNWILSWPIFDGLRETYDWIKKQVDKAAVPDVVKETT